MKRSGWLRTSPALVIACLALFVALGGTVLAAKKINGRTIKVKSLPGNRLVVASVPGNRIVPRSLRGAQIRLGTLGEVPSATHAGTADSARHADTATAADHAADATTINGHTVGCLPGRRQFGGACWDLLPSTAAVNAVDAATACAAQGGELPAVLPLLAFARQPGIQIAVGGEWTSQIAPLASNVYDGIALTRSGELLVGSAQLHFDFRCVTPLLA